MFWCLQLWLFCCHWSKYGIRLNDTEGACNFEGSFSVPFWLYSLCFIMLLSFFPHLGGVFIVCLSLLLQLLLFLIFFLLQFVFVLFTKTGIVFNGYNSCEWHIVPSHHWYDGGIVCAGLKLVWKFSDSRWIVYIIYSTSITVQLILGVIYYGLSLCSLVVNIIIAFFWFSFKWEKWYCYSHILALVYGNHLVLISFRHI